MSTQENKDLVRRLYDAVNQNNLAVLDGLISPNFVTYMPDSPQPLYGATGVKQTFMTSRSAFPDMYVTVNDLIAEEDKVVVIYNSRGTNLGPIMNMPPTGQPMMFVGIDIWRIVGGKIGEYFGLQQLVGAPPPMR